MLAGCAVRQGTSSARKETDQGSFASSAFHWSVRTALGEVQVRADDASGKKWLPYVSQAAAQVAQVWPKRTPSLSVRIYTSDADFEADVTDLDEQNVAATDSRGILIAPSADRVLKPQGKVNVLAHELTHWELGQYGGNCVPLWVREGLAEWTAQRNVAVAKSVLWPELAKPLRALPDGPPNNDTFEAEPALSYETAAAYVTYLQHYAGITAVRALASIKSSSSASYQHKVEKMLKPNTPSFSTWLSSVLRG